MSHCNFNFKCSNTQQQEEFFNVKTEKNVYESFSSNIENQKDNQPNNHKDWLNSSSLFSNFNRKGNKHISHPHYYKELRILEAPFKAKQRLNILMNNGTCFNKLQNILQKWQEKKKNKNYVKKKHKYLKVTAVKQFMKS